MNDDLTKIYVGGNGPVDADNPLPPLVDDDNPLPPLVDVAGKNDGNGVDGVDETGEDANQTGQDANPNGEDANPNGEDANPNGEDANPNGEDANPNGEDAKQTGQDAKQTGQDANQTGQDSQANNDDEEIDPLLVDMLLIKALNVWRFRKIDKDEDAAGEKDEGGPGEGEYAVGEKDEDGKDGKDGVAEEDVATVATVANKEDDKEGEDGAGAVANEEDGAGAGAVANEEDGAGAGAVANEEDGAGAGAGDVTTVANEEDGAGAGAGDEDVTTVANEEDGAKKKDGAEGGSAIKRKLNLYKMNKSESNDTSLFDINEIDKHNTTDILHIYSGGSGEKIPPNEQPEISVGDFIKEAIEKINQIRSVWDDPQLNQLVAKINKDDAEEAEAEDPEAEEAGVAGDKKDKKAEEAEDPEADEAGVAGDNKDKKAEGAEADDPEAGVAEAEEAEEAEDGGSNPMVLSNRKQLKHRSIIKNNTRRKYNGNTPLYGGAVQVKSTDAPMPANPDPESVTEQTNNVSNIIDLEYTWSYIFEFKKKKETGTEEQETGTEEQETGTGTEEPTPQPETDDNLSAKYDDYIIFECSHDLFMDWPKKIKTEWLIWCQEKNLKVDLFGRSHVFEFLQQKNEEGKYRVFSNITDDPIPDDEKSPELELFKKNKFTYRDILVSLILYDIYGCIWNPTDEEQKIKDDDKKVQNGGVKKGVNTRDINYIKRRLRDEISKLSPTEKEARVSMKISNESTVAKPPLPGDVEKAEEALLQNIETLIKNSETEIGQLLQVDEMIYFTSIAPLIADFMSTPSDIGKLKKLIAFLVMNFNALFIFNVVMSIAIMNDDLGGTIITSFNTELANPEIKMSTFYKDDKEDFTKLSSQVREAWTISQEWTPGKERSLGKNMKSIQGGGGLKFTKEHAKKEKEALLKQQQQQQKEGIPAPTSKVAAQGSPQQSTSIVPEEHFKKLLELMDEYRGIKGSYNKWYEADKFQYQFKIGRDYDLSKDNGNLPNDDDIIYIDEISPDVSLISGTYFKKDDNKYYNYKKDAKDEKKIHEIIIYKEKSGKYIFSYDGLKFSTTELGNKKSIKNDVMNKKHTWESDEKIEYPHKETIKNIIEQLNDVYDNMNVSNKIIPIVKFQNFVSCYVEKTKSKLPDINDKTKMLYESVRNTYRISMFGTVTNGIEIKVQKLDNYKYCKKDIDGKYTLQYDNKKGLPYFKNNNNTTTLTFDTIVLCGDIFNDKNSDNCDNLGENIYYQKWILASPIDGKECKDNLRFCLYIPHDEHIFQNDTENWFWSGISEKNTIQKNTTSKITIRNELKIEPGTNIPYDAKTYFISADLDSINAKYEQSKQQTAKLYNAQVVKDSDASLTNDFASPNYAVQDKFTPLLQLMESNKGWPKTYNKYYEADTFQLQFEIGRFADKDAKPDYIYIQEMYGVSFISGTYFLNKNGKYYNYKKDTDDDITKIHEIIIYKEPKSNKIVFNYDGSLLFINGSETDNISKVIFDNVKWAEMSWTFSTELKTTIMGELQKIRFVNKVQSDVADKFNNFIINYEIYNKALFILKLELKLPDVNKSTVAKYISIRNTYRAYMDINKTTPLESTTLQFTILADTNEIKEYLYCKSNIKGTYKIVTSGTELPYFVNIADENVTLKFKRVVMYKDIFNQTQNDDKDKNEYYQKWVLDNSNESNCDKKLLFCLYIPFKETIFSSNTDNWFWSGISEKRALLKNIPKMLVKSAISLKYDTKFSDYFPDDDQIKSFFSSNHYIKEDEYAEAAKAAEAEEAKSAKAAKAAEAEAAKAAKALEKARIQAESRNKAEEEKERQRINKQTLRNKEYENLERNPSHSQNESPDASLLNNSDGAEDAEDNGGITNLNDHEDEEDTVANIQSRGGPTSYKPQNLNYSKLEEGQGNSGKSGHMKVEVNMKAPPLNSQPKKLDESQNSSKGQKQTDQYKPLSDVDGADMSSSQLPLPTLEINFNKVKSPSNDTTKSQKADGYTKLGKTEQKPQPMLPANADDWDDDDAEEPRRLKIKIKPLDNSQSRANVTVPHLGLAPPTTKQVADDFFRQAASSKSNSNSYDFFATSPNTSMSAKQSAGTHTGTSGSESKKCSMENFEELTKRCKQKDKKCDNLGTVGINGTTYFDYGATYLCDKNTSILHKREDLLKKSLSGGKRGSKRKTIHTHTRKSYNKYNSNYSSPKRIRYTDMYLDII